MRQFDVFENPSAQSRAAYPFVVVLQSHLLDEMPTAVVAPLLKDDGRSAYAAVSVAVDWEGASYLISVAELAAVDIRALNRAGGNLVVYEDQIRRALERVFTGF